MTIQCLIRDEAQSPRRSWFWRLFRPHWTPFNKDGNLRAELEAEGWYFTGYLNGASK